MRAVVLPTSLAFCARLRPALRPLAAGWRLVFALMSPPSAEGPWADPIAYARAFTECCVVGCLVVAGSFWRTSRPGALTAAGAFMLAAVWLLRVSQVRAG